MKLDDKISSKKIVFLLTGESIPAFELALLYFIQAKEKPRRAKNRNPA